VIDDGDRKTKQNATKTHSSAFEQIQDNMPDEDKMAG
jgi:hypothetical protein